MENVITPQVQYTLSEKYFQVEPENRIRRYQYFVRSIVPSILMALAMIVWGAILIPIFGTKLLGMGKVLSIAWLVIWLGISYFFYKLAKNNSIKRCHDFGNDGRIALKIIQISFILGVDGLIVFLLEVLWILPSINPLALLSQANETMSADQIKALMSGWQPIHQKILGVAQQIVWLASLILWIFLMFRPGNKGDNAYGKDPINTKVAFLG